MGLKFKSIVIFVQDIERSRNFYEKILNQKIKNDFGENIEFESGFSIWYTPHAHQIIFNKPVSVNKGSSFELYFESEAIDDICDKIKKEGMEMIQDLHEEPWGHKTFRFYDPDKYIVEVGETFPVWITRMYKSGMSVDEIHNQTTLPISEIENILNGNK